MSDDNTFALGKLIPGFDFLQQLTSTNKGAPKSAPGLRHWIAPTVSVEELDKRITELRAVQFWLEQNLLALKATIQALEVQKMTLATLRDMNLSVAEVAKAFTLPKSEERAAPEEPPAEETAKRWPYKDKGAASTAKAPPAPAESAPQAREAEAAEPAEPPSAPRGRSGRKGGAASSSAGVADPMQWWGALTQQFQQIAAETLREASRAMPAPADEAAGAAAADDAAPKAAQPAAKKTARKSAAKKKAPAKKAAARKAPAKKASPAPTLAAGWPLPTPFKLGRR